MKAIAAFTGLLMSGASARASTGHPSVPKVALEETLRSYEVFGFPLTGEIHYRIDLETPDHDLSRATGKVSFYCLGCSLGDGLATVAMPTSIADPSANLVLPIAKIGLGDLVGEVNFLDGKGSLSIASSDKGDLSLAGGGTVALGPTLENSQIELRFTVSMRPSLTSQIQILFPLLAASRDLANFTFNVTGSLANPRLDLPNHDKQRAVISRTKPEISAAPVLPEHAKLPDNTHMLRLEDLPQHVKRRGKVMTVSKHVFYWILDNLALFAEGGKIVPSVNDGKTDGFQLVAIVSGSLYDICGFQNGDRLVMINDLLVVSSEVLWEVYAAVRQTSKITVDFVRKGKKLQRIFEIESPN